MTEQRSYDRKLIYTADYNGPDLQAQVVWWPTNRLAAAMTVPSASTREVESNQLVVFVSLCAYACMMLYQVGWYEVIAMAAWSGFCTVTFAIATIVSWCNQSPAGLRWWCAFSAPMFIAANYVACGCQPYHLSGGRFVAIGLFGAAPLVGMGFSSFQTIGFCVLQLVAFAATAVLEGVNVSCFDTKPSSVHVVIQVLCQLVVPLVLVAATVINMQRKWQRVENQMTVSNDFARLCVRNALQGDIEGLGKLVHDFDASAVTIPTMSDDALSVVIDLLQKTAKSVEERQGGRRPGSRSPSQQGLLVVPIGANNSGHSSDEDGSSGRKRRSSGRLLSLDVTASPMLPPFPVPEKGLVILTAFTLPNMQAYADHPNANVELAKMFLTEFVDHCRTAAGRYSGVVCFSSFESVYCRFNDALSAAAASLCMVDLMAKSRGHYPDVAVHDTRVLYPMCVMLQSHALLGTFGSGPLAQCETIGFANSELIFQRIAELKRSGGLEKVHVVAPVSMQQALREGFVVRDCHAELVEVVKSNTKDAEGFPVVPPTGDAVIVRVAQYALPTLSPSIPYCSSVSMSASTSSSKVEARRTSAQRPLSVPPEALAAWDTYDKDGSGTLDLEECRGLLESIGYRMTEEDIQRFFEEVDKDGSGTISKQEFAAAFASPNLGGAAVMDRITKAGTVIAKSRGGDAVAAVLEQWQKYDKDNSGSLDYSELAALLGDLGMAQSQTELDWLIKKLDRDNSGFVDFDEFSRLFTSDSVTRQVAAKARSQVVTRVVNNKSSGVVYSNDDQLLRDERVHLASVAEQYCTLPLFIYIGYNCGAITFNIAVGSQREAPTTTNIIVDLVLDLFLVAWMLFKYLYLPREDKGQIAFRRMDVLKHSVRTLDFYIDVLSVLPLDFIYIGLGAPVNGEVMAFYRANKLLLYWYLDECYKVITKNFSPAIVRASNAMLYFLSFAHLFACFLIGMARDLGEDADGVVDVIGFDRILSDEERTYPIGLYWAIITLVGQNRGAILPALDKELALLFVAMLVGLPMYAVVLGTIAQAVRVDDSYSKFLDKIDNLRSYFQYTRLPEPIENECIEYYRHLYFTTGSLDIAENPLEDLPAELSIQVVIQIGQEMLRKVPIFQDASKNKEFVHELTTKLVPEVIPPLTTVMKKGERGTNMYFITFGDFNILADNGMAVFTLKKGNFFGEIALLHNVKRTATIQSFGKFSNVLSLDKRDFDEVTQTFPDCLTQVYKAAEDRIKQILEREAEEAKQAREKRKEERDAKRRSAQSNGEELKESSSDDEAAESGRRASGALTLGLSKTGMNSSVHGKSFK